MFLILIYVLVLNLFVYFLCPSPLFFLFSLSRPMITRKKKGGMVVFIEKNPSVSGLAQFEPMLFKGQLQCVNIKSWSRF